MSGKRLKNNHVRVVVTRRGQYQLTVPRKIAINTMKIKKGDVVCWKELADESVLVYREG